MALSLNRKASRLLGSESATSAVEFALLFPITILILSLVIEAYEGFSLKRKLDFVAVDLADVLSRENGKPLNPDCKVVTDAASFAFWPADTSWLQYTVSEIDVDSQGNGIVRWSLGYNGGFSNVGNSVADGLLVGGTRFILPPESTIKNSAVIAAQVQYKWSPQIFSNLIGDIPMQSVVYRNVRSGKQNASCIGS